MRNIRVIVALHAGLAAVFFFVMQRLVLNATLESSWRWSICMGLLAAVLSYKQNVR